MLLTNHDAFYERERERERVKSLRDFNLLQKTRKTILFVVFTIFAVPSFVFATARYAPGETLNPACGPTDLTCTVSAPLYTSASLDLGSSPQAGYYTATSSTATSTFAGGIESYTKIGAPYFIATSTTATSTFSGGISVAGSSGLTVLQNGKVGVGTMLPTSKLSINGENKFSSPHKVYLMGDSLTGTSGHYGTQFATDLGGSWDVIWKGVSGNSTTAMLTRFSTDILTPGDAEYVVIWGGVNDIVGVVAGSVTVATIKSNLQAMYDLAHNAGLKVVAVNVTPFSGDAGWASSGAVARAAQDEINYWIANTAKNIDYRVDAYSALVDPSVPYTLLATYDDGGHLHLTSAGYIVVADTIYNATTWTPLTIPTMDINGNPVFSGALQVTGTISASNLSGKNTGDQNLTGLVPYTGATSNLNLGLFSASTTQLTTTGNAYFASSGTGSIRVDNNFSADSGGSIKWGVNVDTSDRVGFLSWDTGKVIIGSPTTMDLSFVTSFTSERMRILQSNGNVGIGTSTPNNKLDIYSATKSALSFSGGTTAGQWTMGYDVTNGRFAIASSTALGTTDRLVILSNGNVGIGTTSPGAKLTVNGSTYFAGAVLSTSTVTFSGLATNAAANALCIDATGNITTAAVAACSGVSSQRYKHDITGLDMGLSSILALRPVSFRFNQGYGDSGLSSQFGLIAEEVNTVDSRLTTLDKDGQPNAVRYDFLAPILIKAIQEQQLQIDVLMGSTTSSVSSSGFLQNIFNGFLDFLSSAVARVKSLFVDELHIQDKICIDDECYSKEVLRQILRNSGATPLSNSPTSSNSDNYTTTSDFTATTTPTNSDTTATTTEPIQIDTATTSPETITTPTPEAIQQTDNSPTVSDTNLTDTSVTQGEQTPASTEIVPPEPTIESELPLTAEPNE